MSKLFKSALALLMAFSMITIYSPVKVQAMEYSMGCDAYELAWINDQGGFDTIACYGSFAEAKAAMTQDDYVVRHPSSKSPTKIIAIALGIAYSYPRRNGSTTMNVYQHANHITEKEKYKSTYVIQHRELFQPETVSHDGTDGNVKFVLQGFTGYAKLSSMDLVPMKFIERGFTITLGGQTNDSGIYENPFEMIPKMSHYQVVQNGNYKDLVYTYYSGYNGEPSQLTIGQAARWMSVGQVYFSKDGINFYSDAKMTNYLASYYNYYLFLPLRSRSLISGDTLNAYLAYKGYTEKPTSTSINDLTEKQSQLAGEGATFVDNQNMYGVNALLTYAMACNESGYGRSNFAVSKNNLFGWAAVDSDPNNATQFSSIALGIQEQMAYNLRGYMDAYDVRFFGMHLGTKESGFNVKYASDPYWGMKIAAIAYDIDKFSKNFDGTLSDHNAYSLGVIAEFKTPYYASASSSSSTLFTSEYSSLYQEEHIVVLKGESNDFYQVQLPNAILADGTILKHKVSGTQQPATAYDFSRSVGYIQKDKISLLNDFNNVTIPGQTPEGEFVFALSQFTISEDGVLSISGSSYRPGIYITQINQLIHSLLVFDEFYDKIDESRMTTTLKEGTQDHAEFTGTLDLSELEDGNYYFRFTSDYSSLVEYSDTRVLNATASSVETETKKYTFKVDSDVLWLNVETKEVEEPLDPEQFEHLSMLSSISMNSESLISIKGISLVRYLNHGENDVKHELVAVHVETGEETTYPLKNSLGDYSLTNVYKDGYSYDYCWFNDTVDVSELPLGNYTLYIKTSLYGMSFMSKLYGKSSASESAMILGEDGLYRQLQMRYAVSYRADFAVTKYNLQKETKNELPRIREGYQNLVSFKYIEETNTLKALGTAFIWNGTFAQDSGVKYSMIALNTVDGSVDVFETEGSNLYNGKAPLWDNTQIYGEGFDYEYTWYSIDIPVDSLTDGKYEFILKIETNEYVEYVDLRKTVDSGLAVYDSEALSITSRIDEKQNNKVQMTIQRNISSQDEE